MANDKERILVVENDPMIGDLIARQALGSMGFEVRVVEEAGAAMQAAQTFKPDVVIANLDLPGLSGKDLMAALASQNVRIPVIMTAAEGEEKDVIQAFRLGAADYIGSPVREAEVVAVVERALATVRARKERERLSQQVQRTNQELKKKVEELTTLFEIGKAVTSITDQTRLFEQIVDGAVKITQADYGWLLVQDERSKEFILRAENNLPKSLKAHLGKAWDDEISPLVARSGETFSIHGKSLTQFKIASLGKAALVAPVKVKRETIALLVVMRKAERAFEAGDEAMLEGVSDYAAISLVNARLFQAVDARAGV